MPKFKALYYPSWNPPPEFFRSTLLFFDEINVIIPKGVEAEYNESNQRICDLLPDVRGEVRESHYEMQSDEWIWKRIEKAFASLVEENNPSEQNFVPPATGANIHVPGHVLLYNAKLDRRIQLLLEEKQLTRPELLPFVESLSGKTGFQIVDERASNLVLSLIADTQAQRFGLRTITDKPLPFAVNFLNSETTSRARANAALASVIIQSQIPQTIKDISPEEFVELRKRFEEIRLPFKIAIEELSNNGMLHSISDKKTFESALVDITRSYQDAMKGLHSKLSDKFTTWIPFNLTALATIHGLFSSIDPDENMANMATTLAMGAVTIGVSYYQQVTSKPFESNVTKSQRLLAGLRSELLNPELIRRMTT